MDEVFRYLRLEHDKEIVVDIQRTSLESLAYLLQYFYASGQLAELQHFQSVINRELIRRGRVACFGRE